MECESCEKREAEVDALISGEYKRMCKTCAHLEGAVVIEKPARNNVMESYKRATVKEVLMRMSGVPKSRPVQPANNLRLSPIQTNRVTIGGKKIEEEYHSNDSGSKIVSNFPQRAQMQQAQSQFQSQAPIAVQALEAGSQAQKVQPKKGFFSRLFGGRSNESGGPSPTDGPSVPPMGSIGGTKRMATADDGVLEL